jgi:hypothetical protein
MQEIIGEILFNNVTIVPQEDDKFIESKMGIQFHNVPEYRFITNLNHRFWDEVGFFG